MDAHRKGGTWRRLVAVWFQSHGFEAQSRGIGWPGDDIEVDGPGLALSVEAKNHRRIDLAAFVDQAERQSANGRLPLCVIKRRGTSGVDGSYVVMSAKVFARLIKDGEA